MRKFFIPTGSIEGQKAFISGSDAHHLAHVLRKKPGDIIEATDGQGHIIRAEIIEIKPLQISLAIKEITEGRGRKIFVRLYQALPKGSKFDLIVEKASELGVNEIVPVITERTVFKADKEGSIKKIARWERIARETIKQTGRNTEILIHQMILIEKIGGIVTEGSLKIVPWELEEELSLKELLLENKEAKTVELFIGPEGGFSHKEVRELKAIGFKSVSLGNMILKTETAAIAAVSNIYFAFE